MISTLKRVYRFAGKMQGTMKSAVLFSVLHSIFDMLSFAALALVFSGIINGFDTVTIWQIFGITFASMVLKIFCSYITDFGKCKIGYAAKRQQGYPAHGEYYHQNLCFGK